MENGFANVFVDLVEKSKQMIMSRPTHLEDDGFLHCDECGEAMQMFIGWKDSRGKENRWLVGKTCRCIEERKARESEELRRQNRMARVSHNAYTCFEDKQMQSWTFDGADQTPAIEVGKRYCSRFDNCKEDGFGILFTGEVGTGKTFAAACIANRLLMQGYTVKMTTFPHILGKIQEDFSKRNDIIAELLKLDLLIIDDFTVERNTDFANEQIFSVIDGRHKAKKPTIYTANISYADFMRPNETMKKRIYSRIGERCKFYEVKGSDRRRASMKSNYDGIFNF